MRRLTSLRLLGFVVPVVLSTACATALPPPAAHRPCEVNFNVDASDMLLRRYSTFQDFIGATKTQTFDRIAANFSRNGYTLTSTNRDVGAISAQVNAIGSGQPVPINATISSTAAGSRAEVIAILRGGMMASTERSRSEFCKHVEP